MLVIISYSALTLLRANQLHWLTQCRADPVLLFQTF